MKQRGVNISWERMSSMITSKLFSEDKVCAWVLSVSRRLQEFSKSGAWISTSSHKSNNQSAESLAKAISDLNQFLLIITQLRSSQSHPNWSINLWFKRPSSLKWVKRKLRGKVLVRSKCSDPPKNQSNSLSKTLRVPRSSICLSMKYPTPRYLFPCHNIRILLI